MVVVYILKLIEKNWEKIGGVRLEIGNKFSPRTLCSCDLKKVEMHALFDHFKGGSLNMKEVVLCRLLLLVVVLCLVL